MANLLASENSPYLLQHAENPVDWYPWGEPAFEKARQLNKPIFLSIGYAACHWCHVMAHESFEDPVTAEMMNENFVNIKVDREERPDVDNIYMNAVVAMTGQGGWPLSVFMTPDGRPFYGGTYFPPQDRFNMPSFRKVLLSVSKTWNENRTGVEESGQKITQHLNSVNRISPGQGRPSRKDLDTAAMALAQAYDWKYGGWGSAPKFPQPMTIEFLLRRASRGDRMALDISLHTLKEMAKGGMYDVIGGGFARYSTDNEWLVPHFEKMLYDNAQLALVYLYAHLLTDDPQMREVCEATLDFIKRELTDPQGGFYSSLDADSEGVEGLFYTWTWEELKDSLSVEEFDLLSKIYAIKEGGNFEGRIVLQRAKEIESLSEELSMPHPELTGKLEQIHSKLFAVREQRVRPGLDDKVLVAWNGLAMVAFSEAAKYLKSNQYEDMAIRNAEFLLTNMAPDERLLRSWRAGKADHKAYLEDYASLILGLLALYELNGDPGWYDQANRLADEMIDKFTDPEFGFFDTGSDHEQLLLRPKDVQDNATPSGNALAANALLRLGMYAAKTDWMERAEKGIASVLNAAKRYPTAFGQWLCAADFLVSDPKEVAIIGERNDPGRKALVSALWSAYRPDLVAAISTIPIPDHSPPLLHDRGLYNDQATAYVCKRFICKQPVNTAGELTSLLEEEITN